MRHLLLLLRLRPLLSLPSKPPPLRLSTTTTTDPLLTQANLLIPRLCLSNNLPDAIRLLSSLLPSTSPTLPLPPSSPILLDHLTSDPSMSHTMSLLTRLHHTPSTHPSLPSLLLSLLSSYLHKHKPKEALKILLWMLRPDSVSPPDRPAFRVSVIGLFGCRAGLEGLRALREMARAGFDPGVEVREVVFRGLLWVAFVREAKLLDEALLECVDGGGDAFQRALGLLDQIISKWEY